MGQSSMAQAVDVHYLGIMELKKSRGGKSKSLMEQRAPKLIENDKTTMFVRGGNTSHVVSLSLKDLYLLKKPAAVFFRRKNIVKPFEDATSIEFFSAKSDSSLFMFGCHSKKRPHNITIGRMFDHRLLDMVEFGIENYKPLQSCKASGCVLGSKPCLIFAGDCFETDALYIRLKNVFIDFFRGTEVKKVSLAGLDHVVCFIAVSSTIHLRTYQVKLMRSAGQKPRVELLEMGPSMDLHVRRSTLASEAVFKQATAKPRRAMANRKNVVYDKLGSKFGRVHMQTQRLQNLQTRKLKGLKH